MLGDDCNRATRRPGRRVEPEELQGLQGVHRCRPGLAQFAAGVGRREAGAAVPQPVGTLERQKTRAPALPLHARSFGGDLVGRRVREIAQHLPADGRIGVEQPIDHVHRRSLTVRRAACMPRATG